MALFFLDYDLRKVRDYKSLYEELAKFNAVRVLESSWCFNTNCSTLRDHFKKFIDADDGLNIVEVIDWATYGAINTPNEL